MDYLGLTDDTVPSTHNIMSTLFTWGNRGLGYKTKRGEASLIARFKTGNRTLGKLMGYYRWRPAKNRPQKRTGIFYCGTVTIGMVPHHLGVCPWRTEIFLCRFNEIWLLDNVELDDKNQIPSPAKMNKVARRIWADSIARLVADRLTPQKEMVVMSEATRRYQALVAALVNERCIKAATYGRTRTATDYAKGISIDWTQGDLLRPREPTLMHALMTALVLALPAAKATELIKLGAWLEYRIPVFSTESALALFHNACWQLSRLSPTWHAESYLCDWNILGPLDSIFHSQFMRIMGAASARELPIEDVAGCSAKYGASDTTQTTDPYLSQGLAMSHTERARLRHHEE